MRRSGLLNNLSNPIFPIQAQFCFIHLTIQEFLAAKNVTETQSPEEIKNFISSNVKHACKWHLVLQFIAGILGQRMKMSTEEYQRYKDCVLAFTESFRIGDNNKLELCADNNSVFVMKCLREAGNIDIVKEACEKAAMNDVLRLSYNHGPRILSSSEWAAVFFVCKQMKELTDIYLKLPDWSDESYMEFCKLLQQRCIKKLSLKAPGLDVTLSKLRDPPLAKPFFEALMKSMCTLDHQHSELIKLELRRLSTDESLSTILDFFKRGHASYLEILALENDGLTSTGIAEIIKVLDEKLCPELKILNLSLNNILDESVRMLCKALIKCRQLKLT
ncbi:uncharacterized protein LOC114529079 [Dendronephthya gigantea]|uniref:uncharacterized protein LOC114529079 n=1 Tax=Dendronephthya gigantea TaxID=151771 RepID=UPI00106B40B4|nr:uncharacterized protein LOC114529079 [Dendronephthya gigantea]